MKKIILVLIVLLAIPSLALAVKPDNPGCKGDASTGMKVYADGVLLGAVIDFYINPWPMTGTHIWGEIAILSDKNFIVKIRQRPDSDFSIPNAHTMYFPTSDCSGQGYTEGNAVGEIFQGMVFRSDYLENPIFAYYAFFNETGTPMTLPFRLGSSGCVEMESPSERTVCPVYPNDPEITGIVNPQENNTYMNITLEN